MAGTATHYDTLGVTSRAELDNIRRAYYRLARDLHPDRHADSGPTERERADRRMREVNEAWRVLGDRQRRLRYDLELAGADLAPEPRRRDVSTDFDERQESYRSDDPPAGLGSLLLAGFPYFAILGLLAVIVVFTAYAASDPPEPAPVRDPVDASVPVAQIGGIGECVRFVQPQVTQYVPCTALSEGRIVELAPRGQPCPEGTMARYLTEISTNVCLDTTP